MPAMNRTELKKRKTEDRKREREALDKIAKELDRRYRKYKGNLA